jgi:AcrR family transcriptional regulator
MVDEDARSRIREVALERFGRRGIRDTSTREILKAAGMKNPSAITYHFGSKAKLVENLVSELIESEAPVLQTQIALAAGTEPPTVEQWTSVAVDSATRLVSTERGCLLARLWWDYHNSLYPDVFEAFLGSGSTLATDWFAAVSKTFRDLSPRVAVTRNLIALRTLEWMTVRRASRLLESKATPAMRMDDPETFRRLLLEVSLGILTAPTTLTDDDIRFDT